MSKEIESILLSYHANKMSKAEAIAEIEGLIDAERVTLRDTFACQAMNAIVAKGVKNTDDMFDLISMGAYKISDEMLRQRKK